MSDILPVTDPNSSSSKASPRTARGKTLPVEPRKIFWNPTAEDLRAYAGEMPNARATEFGTIKDRAQFDALYAYSPYHRVKDGTAYPAILLTSGENDGRVDPYNSRKMAARLQAAAAPGRPVLLRISADTGHGIGTALNTRVEEDADTYAFMMDALGMEPGLSTYTRK